MMDGEMERIWLATANSELRSEVLALKQEVERLCSVLAIIDNAHEPQVDTDLDSLTMGGLFCTEDDEPWPCRTHLLLHPKEARRER